MILKVNKTHENAQLLEPAHQGDCGFDVCAIDRIVLKAGERFNARTGLSFEFDSNYMCMVCGKSGRAVHNGLTTIGNIIDSSYRGECHVTLVNLGNEKVVIKKGEKIAQFIFFPFAKPTLEFTNNLNDTTRGQNGFGSTGL